MFCSDICFAVEVFGHEYNLEQWRVFTDSSKVSWKVALLHNGKRFPSVLFGHAANMKENYESMKLLLRRIKYDEFKCNLCGDLKLRHYYLECNSVTKILLFLVRMGQP